jgi:hypothetical protein
VPLPFILHPRKRRATLLIAGAFFTTLALVNALAARPDEPQSDSVGVIDGDAITVTGPMSVELVHGLAKTMLRSGSDVRVKSGTARIDLVEGGQISICGPAHLSVLKSGHALTVALESGTIHAHVPAHAGLEGELALTIYTAQIQAHPVAIGDGPEDLLVGFESPGAMCVHANRGAVRMEQQFTGQTVIIPQAGDALLPDGQLENLRESTHHCECELQMAKAASEAPPEISQIASAEEVHKTAAAEKADPAPTPAEKMLAKEEAVYQVFMPPLIYDAKAKVRPEVNPKMIVLVRRVRVRPTLIFHGRVEGEMAAAVPVRARTATAAASPAATKPSAVANDSFVARVRSFVRKLWSR